MAGRVRVGVIRVARRGGVHACRDGATWTRAPSRMCRAHGDDTDRGEQRAQPQAGVWRCGKSKRHGDRSPASPTLSAHPQHPAKSAAFWAARCASRLRESVRTADGGSAAEKTAFRSRYVLDGSREKIAHSLIYYSSQLRRKVGCYTRCLRVQYMYGLWIVAITCVSLANALNRSQSCRDDHCCRCSPRTTLLEAAGGGACEALRTRRAHASWMMRWGGT